ncbi:MAG TPA: hypothetical protein VEC35_01400 [Noviherbaspirillum sp.]|nr:hypothetical protein [Noviherbaspirillum sp.]
MILAVNLAAAAVIFGVGLFGAINNMSRCTKHGIRFAWVVMVTGAGAVLLGPVYGSPTPTWSDVVLNVGIAAFVVTNRRRVCADKRGAQ